MARPIAVNVVIALAVCLSAPPSPATWGDVAAGASGPQLLVGGMALGPEVPPAFLGISVETAALHTRVFAPDRPVLARLFAALGPGLLRFGGNTLDHAAWAPAGTFPGATSVVTPEDLVRMFAFVRPIGWTVLLGLDLGHYDPAAAADEAATAARLGGTALAALEFGNEPDLYVRSYAGALRPSSYGVRQYLHQWQAYLRAVRRRVPGATVVGPGIAGIPGSLGLLRQFAAQEHNQIACVTAHHYPLGAPITDPHSPAYASIANLVSPGLRARDADEVGGWAQSVADVGEPLRLTETNSVFGGGEHGVSDTLAGALWTVDYLFRVAALGLTGVNLHATLDRCGGYTPICALTTADAQRDRFHVQPNYYALLLFHAAARGRFLPTRVAGDPRITAYATRDRGGATRVALVNVGARAVRIRVRVFGPTPGGAGSLMRLTGPALDATSGVTFGGRAVGMDGRWRAGPVDRIQITGGAVQLRLPPASATVLVLPPAS
jgi:hypothetical protein